MKSSAPIITIEFSGESDLWQLVVTSFGKTEPAGPRLFRGGDLPVIKFLHSDEMDAIHDAGVLQKYCDAAWSGRKLKKTMGREEADIAVDSKMDLSDAVWNY